MKSQTDLIVTIVAVLIMLIGVGVCFGTQPPTQTKAAPEKVITAPAALPAADVVMADSLPGGNAGGGALAGGGAAPGGVRGGPRGMMGAGAAGGGGMQTAAGGADATGGGGAPMAMGVSGGR